ncbi:MAG: tetratricopeptide repeat protein [Dehalococcoidia bacterium]|nr:tetratricopeptide repeat protein [Dehalococcoidia bacterium]
MSTMDGTGETNLQALLDIAMSLVSDGDPEAALQVYNDILALTPRNAEALLGKGRALMGVERYDQAVRFLERAAESDPTRADVWGMLGTAALAMGNGETALDAFKRLQRFGVEPAQNYLNLARAAYYSLDLERARGYTDLSTAENPNLALAKEWESALKAIPNHAAFLVNVGRAHCRRGRFEQGLSMFITSLKEQESVDGHLYAGRAMLAQGKPSEAVEHLRRARELDANSTELLPDLASALALAGDSAQSARIYEDILAAKPDDVDALIGRAQLLLQENDSAAARPFVSRLVELAPDQPETWLLQSRVLVDAGDSFNARLATERAIVRDSHSPLTWLAAAELMQLAGLPGLAQLCHGRAEFAVTGKSPNTVGAPPPVLPELSVEMAELDDAGLPDDRMAEALKNRVTVYANLGQVERALHYLRQLTSRLPQYVTDELARHEGSLLLKLHDPSGARRAFERALELDPNSQRAQLALQRLDALAV